MKEQRREDRKGFQRRKTSLKEWEAEWKQMFYTKTMNTVKQWIL